MAGLLTVLEHVRMMVLPFVMTKTYALLSVHTPAQARPVMDPVPSKVGLASPGLTVMLTEAI